MPAGRSGGHARLSSATEAAVTNDVKTITLLTVVVLAINDLAVHAFDLR
jgi:hypothetical protein